MKAVFDANFFINKDSFRSDITKGFIPHSVELEIKDISSKEYYEFYNFSIEVRDPQTKYVSEVLDAITGFNEKHFNLSKQDIDVVALMLEISQEGADSWIGPDNISTHENVMCFTKDNGIKNALAHFGLLEDDKFVSKTYKMRCFCCFKIYDEHVDFCRSCGYNTITRVSVIKDDGKEIICFKKNFKPFSRAVKDFHGRIIPSEDSKEYSAYKKEIRRRGRFNERILKENKL